MFLGVSMTCIYLQSRQGSQSFKCVVTDFFYFVLVKYSKNNIDWLIESNYIDESDVMYETARVIRESHVTIQYNYEFELQ